MNGLVTVYALKIIQVMQGHVRQLLGATDQRTHTPAKH